MIKRNRWWLAGLLVVQALGCSGADIEQEPVETTQEALCPPNPNQCMNDCDTTYDNESSNCDQAYDDGDISWPTYVDCGWSAWEGYGQCLGICECMEL